MLGAPALGEPGRDRMRNPSGLCVTLDMGIARATIKDNGVAEQKGFEPRITETPCETFHWTCPPKEAVVVETDERN